MLQLPSNETTFFISVEEPNTKQKLEGNFTYKRPSLGKELAIQTTVARSVGDVQGLSSEVKGMFFIIAFLQHCIVSAPDWWKNSNSGQDLYDATVVLQIYNKCKEFDDQFEKKVFGDNPKDVTKE